MNTNSIPRKHSHHSHMLKPFLLLLLALPGLAPARRGAAAKHSVSAPASKAILDQRVPKDMPTCTSGWSVVPSPNPSSYYNSLEGVTAFADDDVWAVGWHQDYDQPVQTL